MKQATKNSLRRALLAFAPVWLIMAGIGWLVGATLLGVGLGFAILIVGWSLIYTQELRRLSSGGVPELEDLHPYTRSKLQAIYRTHREIRRVLARNSESWATTAVATEVKQAADELLAQAYRLAEACRQLHDFLLPAREARAKLAELEDQPTHQNAREALEAEIRQYDSIEAKSQQLESTLADAEATLRELKSRVVVAIGEAAHSEVSPDELRAALSRARTIGSSIDEAVRTLLER